MTSGPIVPVRIGKLIDGEPSEKVIVAVRSVMVVVSGAVGSFEVEGMRSGGAQLREQRRRRTRPRLLRARR